MTMTLTEDQKGNIVAKASGRSQRASREFGEVHPRGDTMTLDLDELERLGKAAANPQTRGRYEDIDDEGMAFLQSALNDGNWQAMIEEIRQSQSEVVRLRLFAANKIAELEAENKRLSTENTELESRVNALKCEVNKAAGDMKYPPM